MFTRFCFTHFSFSIAHSLSPSGGHCPNLDFELSFSFTSLSLELWSSNLTMTQNLLGSLVNVRISGCTLREWELVGLGWGLGDCISNKLPRDLHAGGPWATVQRCCPELFILVN